MRMPVIVRVYEHKKQCEHSKFACMRRPFTKQEWCYCVEFVILSSHNSSPLIHVTIVCARPLLLLFSYGFTSSCMRIEKPFSPPLFSIPIQSPFSIFSAFLLLLMPHVPNLSQFTFSPSCFQRIATEANTSNPFLSMEIPGEFDWINTIQFTEHGYFLFSTNLHADFYLHQSHLELILYVGSSCRVSPLLNTSAKTFLSALYIIGDPLFYSSACYFCLFACVRA